MPRRRVQKGMTVEDARAEAGAAVLAFRQAEGRTGWAPGEEKVFRAVVEERIRRSVGPAEQIAWYMGRWRERFPPDVAERYAEAAEATFKAFWKEDLHRGGMAAFLLTKECEQARIFDWSASRERCREVASLVKALPRYEKAVRLLVSAFVKRPDFWGFLASAHVRALGQLRPAARRIRLKSDEHFMDLLRHLGEVLAKCREAGPEETKRQLAGEHAHCFGPLRYPQPVMLMSGRHDRTFPSPAMATGFALVWELRRCSAPDLMVFEGTGHPMLTTEWAYYPLACQWLEATFADTPDARVPTAKTLQTRASGWANQGVQRISFDYLSPTQPVDHSRNAGGETGTAD